jgi:hypothetical protein
MRLNLSNRALTALLIFTLAFSAVNTFLILYRTSVIETQLSEDLASLEQRLNETNAVLNQTVHEFWDEVNREIIYLKDRLPIEQYDYVVYRYWDNVSVFVAKNGKTGLVDFNSTDAAFVFNQALSRGNTVYVKADEYTLNADVAVVNKKNARLDSDGASLTLNGKKILVKGDDYQRSQYNQVSGFRIVNGTLRIENSFMTTVANMIFENSTVGIELANTKTWTEGTEIDTVHFNKCTQALVFRTNTTGATGSYGNTELSRCYFNMLDNSIAITVEEQAEFTDSQLQNVRIWIGEFGQLNQTGLKLDGSMYQTLLDGVVFESFATGDLENAALYAVAIGRTAFQSPVFQAGVSILGQWTARVYNPFGGWIYGDGVFSQSTAVPVNPFKYGQVAIIQMHPATITSFKPRITVQGTFSHNETVTVRFRLEFLDNAVSSSVEKAFNTSASLWLSDDDLITMFPSQNVVYAILVDAKVNAASTDATVQVDVYGTTT